MESNGYNNYTYMFIHISNNIHFISNYKMNSCIDFEIPSILGIIFERNIF
jgi:hypothetical protein